MSSSLVGVEDPPCRGSQCTFNHSRRKRPPDSVVGNVGCNLWKQFQDTLTIERKPVQGRSRVTTAKEDRHLSITARRNRGATTTQLTHHSYAVTGTLVPKRWEYGSKWMAVMFTDEAGLSLNTDYNRTYTWREPGIHYLLFNVPKIDNYGGGGLMVWAGIMLDGHVF
ncbi:transposable element Tc1 transposase [Trichonephila clavipes]|uniref:Transposable element Tc1 transposase n=1 Tax=Trichonephila clavipes TaxID=2585209 RepID=A0A8X6W0G3_TRICX|nr:transposable element Tc1 transposase [Trichonephila clavipes]